MAYLAKPDVQEQARKQIQLVTATLSAVEQPNNGELPTSGDALA